MYIADETIERLSPGAILGDAKTVETRRRPIQIGANGLPVDVWRKGLVAYIDEDGYARPFNAATTDQIPYGVVAEINVMPQNTVVYTNSQAYNTVLLVVSGVVGVEYISLDGGSEPAAVGDRVNQFGGKYRPDTNDVIIGVCDGVAKSDDGITPTPAVRFGATLERQTGKLDDGDFIEAYFSSPIVRGTPVYWGGKHTVTRANANDAEYPIAMQWDEKQVQRFEGFAADSYEAGEIGQVQVSGEITLPYYIPDDSANAVAPYRIVRVGLAQWFVRACQIIAAIGEVCNVVFGTVSKGVQVAKTIKELRGNEAGRVVANRTNANVGDDPEPEPEITGWITIAMNPRNDLSTVTLDTAVMASANDAPLVGHVYGGSDSSVSEFLSNFDGVPFYGVCISDQLDESGKAVFAHEGTVNVLAHTAWHAGDYIDYMRDPIPEAYEQYVARLGTALTDCEAGELGAVELDPYDPNEYIILDYVHISGSVSAVENTAVHRLVTSMYPSLQECIQIVATGNTEPGFDGFDGYPTITGIFRRGYKNFHPDYAEKGYAYGDRAIIQVGGYAWCTLPSTATLPNPGQPVTHMGRDWIRTVWFSPHDQPEDSAFCQLGTVVSTFSNSEATANTVVVKLDVQHHPNMAPVSDPLRSPIRFGVKNLIPLTRRQTPPEGYEVIFVNPSDANFEISGLDSRYLSSSAWKNRLTFEIIPLNQAAGELTHTEGSETIGTALIDSLVMTDNLHGRIELNPQVPDQWTDPDFELVGYAVIATMDDYVVPVANIQIFFYLDTHGKNQKQNEVN